ncbi:MAG: DUF4293 domain-containing protein [Muribaculaceae bacterium]|nr:DUF4293 domain-containing protein [Muribaculaceae bacterium]
MISLTPSFPVSWGGGRVTAILTFSGNDEATRIEIGGSVVLLVGALVFAAMAYRGIRHDEKLLRAADRLR